MVCRKSIQFCKTIIHRKRTREKRKNKKEGKEGKEYYLLAPLLSLLYLFTQENTSLQLTSPQNPTNNQSIHQSQNVHNRRPLHSRSPPIPPPLYPLNSLLHHTTHHHHHHHPKTKTKTQTKTHLGRNFPLNSMDTFTFADDSPMHEQQQQQQQRKSWCKKIFVRGGIYNRKCSNETFLLCFVFEDFSF